MSRRNDAARWGGLMTLKQAKKIIGSYLSETKKMPGYSYNLSATQCRIGTNLKRIPGSVCAKCYAFRGHYQYPVVRRAMARHLTAIDRLQWVPAMATMINWYCRRVPHFRWHDAGDLQSLEHLQKINAVARLSPIVMHWLPTREVTMTKAFLSQSTLAPNLCLRVSEPMIEERTLSGSHLNGYLLTSGVAPRRSKAKWRELVKTNTNALYHCPAILQDGQCQRCRACWQYSVKHVIYPQK